MKEIIFISLWVLFCLLIGGTVIPHLNDEVETQDQYCSTGALSC